MGSISATSAGGVLLVSRPSTGTRQGWPSLAHSLDHRLHKSGQVVRLATGDQVAISDHLGIDVGGAGVAKVVLDGKETSGPLALERLGRAQHPGAVTDRRHH